MKKIRNILNKILYFIDHDRLLTLLIVLVVLMLVVVVVGRKTTYDVTDQSLTPTVMAKDYQSLYSDQSFDYYEYNGKYYVLVKDETTQDKDTIRQYLKISADIDFEVIVNPNLDPVSRKLFYVMPSGFQCCD